MARTPSTMLALGTQAPSFNLPEPAADNRLVALDDYNHQPLLVMFICNHCPYVIQLKAEFTRFANDYQDKGLNIVAINANDVANYPDDSPEKMIVDAKQHHYPFPYLFDETQAVAQAYQATCTPDFFLFDKQHKLFYRGQFDDARPGGSVAASGKDMREAADALLAGQAPPIQQKPSLGCNIKWKAGNEPAY